MNNYEWKYHERKHDDEYDEKKWRITNEHTMEKKNMIMKIIKRNEQSQLKIPWMKTSYESIISLHLKPYTIVWPFFLSLSIIHPRTSVYSIFILFDHSFMSHQRNFCHINDIMALKTSYTNRYFLATILFLLHSIIIMCPFFLLVYINTLVIKLFPSLSILSSLINYCIVINIIHQYCIIFVSISSFPI